MQHGPVGSPSPSPSLASPAGSVSWVARARLVPLVVSGLGVPAGTENPTRVAEGTVAAAVSAVSSVGPQVQTPRKPRGSTQPSPLRSSSRLGTFG